MKKSEFALYWIDCVLRLCKDYFENYIITMWSAFICPDRPKLTTTKSNNISQLSLC